MPRRIGLLGGTFDPPHNAHIEIARAALTADLVDEVVVIPAGEPWQKPDVTSADDRLRMTELAFANEPHCSVSEIEVSRTGATYAIDTLTALSRDDVELRYIVGSDTFTALDTWHRIADVVRLCDFIVVPRPGATVAAPPLSQLEYTTLPMAPLDLSSTDIRDGLLAGGPRPRTLPTAVWNYIVDQQLYGVRHSTLRKPLLLVALALLAAIGVLVSGVTLASTGVFFTRTDDAQSISSGWVAIGVRAPESKGGVITALPVGGPSVDVQVFDLEADDRALVTNDPDALRDAVGTALQRPMAGAIILDRLAFAGLVDAVDGITTKAGNLDGIAAADYALANPENLDDALTALLNALPAEPEKLEALVRSLGAALKATTGASGVVQWMEFWQGGL